MENPNTSENLQSNASSILQDATKTIHDTADRFVGRENRETAEELMNTASERAGRIYDQASTWLRDNNRTAMMIGAVVAVGVIGYLIGRGLGGSSSTEIESY